MNSTPHAPAAPAPALSGLVVAGDRASEVIDFEEQMVAFFIDAADLLGVPKSVAAIYGIVFASPEPLSFAEIEARLSISKGSVSQGLRVLREIGALKEVSAPQDKTERFTPDLELRKLIDRFIENRLQKQFEAGRRRLKALSAGAGAFPNGAHATMKQRVKKLQQWQDRAKGLLPVMRAFLKLGG
jgi:DNA-binding transcriptional regulator GbsR (MarR family)